MDTKKANLAGFIDGLQAGNIMSNKSALEVYANHIQKYLIKEGESTEIIDKIIVQLRTAVPDLQIIDMFIKLGEVYLLLIQNKQEQSVDSKGFALTFLKIAKILKDKRIDDLAISIAEHISTKNGN